MVASYFIRRKPGNPMYSYTRAAAQIAPIKQVRKTPEQTKALKAYNFALQQEDRYLGSVFATPSGQKRYEALTEEAYQRCKSLGMGPDHGL